MTSDKENQVLKSLILLLRATNVILYNQLNFQDTSIDERTLDAQRKLQDEIRMLLLDL